MFANSRQIDDFMALGKAIDEAPEVIACTNYPDAFYPDHSEEGSREWRWAVDTCKQCPIQQQCAEYGIKWEMYGIWGGLSPRQRMALRSRRAGRPTLQSACQ